MKHEQKGPSSTPILQRKCRDKHTILSRYKTSQVSDIFFTINMLQGQLEFATRFQCVQWQTKILEAARQVNIRCWNWIELIQSLRLHRILHPPGFEERHVRDFILIQCLVKITMPFLYPLYIIIWAATGEEVGMLQAGGIGNTKQKNAVRVIERQEDQLFYLAEFPARLAMLLAKGW